MLQPRAASPLWVMKALFTVNFVFCWCQLTTCRHLQFTHSDVLYRINGAESFSSFLLYLECFFLPHIGTVTCALIHINPHYRELTNEQVNWNAPFCFHCRHFSDAPHDKCFVCQCMYSFPPDSTAFLTLCLCKFSVFYIDKNHVFISDGVGL